MIYFERTPGKEQGNRDQILRGTVEQRQNWGTGNIRFFFFIFGEQGNKPIYFIGNKGTGTHPGKVPGEGGACWSVVN